ncbi:extracellular catalytic domain type 1 short-chain-length polyhydroxyalkanoate depolymerase [Variovorax paradoxus]|uniref:extracellular catalytic domain type 1 short-chain-length polyhydroxyalkanoate depolymerase n=1 Tax=Variovorax paradoxus TaxID=34073 RepID=UPI002480F110|nr:PHB depolymerase family esterase [Variovorax paradoxus]WGT63731.1 PHB depolymerase family esterase [Variovorax paradoxus]
MNPLFAGLMDKAALLTRQGRLGEATEAIQRALRSEAEPRPAASGGSNAPTVDPEIIEVEARVIDREPRAPSPGSAEGTEQWVKGTFAHQGRSIDYMLFVPAPTPERREAPQPLVVMLHGCTQNAADFAAGTRMNEHARACGATVLYPEQTQRANGQKCWNWFKSQHQQRGRGEPALLAALTQHVTQQQHADPCRIYVAGLSAGGAMADVLGHCYPDVYAAVGVHSGLPHGAAHDVASALSAMQRGAAPSFGHGTAPRPPTIVFHGDADKTVHASNGLAVFAGATPVEVKEGQSPSGRRFTRTLYAAPSGYGDSEHWRLHGAGHAWSGGSPQGSYTQPEGVDASREILRFFLGHRLDDSRQGGQPS